ncbi:hypothetical protein PENSPDRAFT_653154 [Peniophora sp. CONT]|nr:hypothetical protein PENSPDRAFT_653154 [Peniophora sp. CONT]
MNWTCISQPAQPWMRREGDTSSIGIAETSWGVHRNPARHSSPAIATCAAGIRGNPTEIQDVKFGP